MKDEIWESMTKEEKLEWFKEFVTDYGQEGIDLITKLYLEEREGEFT